MNNWIAGILIAATFLAFPSCDKLGKQKHEVEVIDISDVTEETAQPKKKEKKSPLDCVLASQAVEKNGERVHFYRGYFTNNRAHNRYP